MLGAYHLSRLCRSLPLTLRKLPRSSLCSRQWTISKNFVASTPIEPKPESLWTRFRTTYKYFAKQYGKTLIVVHTLNCSCWFIGCYFAAGYIDVTRLIERVGVSKETAAKYEPKKVVEKMYKYWDIPKMFQWMGFAKLSEKAKPENLGDIAVAFVIYKFVALARYATTAGFTILLVRFLTRIHYFRSLPPAGTFQGFVDEGRKEMALKSTGYQRRIVKRRKKLFRRR